MRLALIRAKIWNFQGCFEGLYGLKLEALRKAIIHVRNSSIDSDYAGEGILWVCLFCYLRNESLFYKKEHNFMVYYWL